MKDRRSGLLAVLGLLAVAAPVSAQDKAMLIDDMERLRHNTLRMVEAMPAAGLRTAPTEGVRDFAEQIEHVAVGALNITASGLDADRIPVGDKEVYLNSKEELAKMVAGAFDQVRSILEAMSQEELTAQGMLFGQTPTPRWKIVQAAHEHGVWTLGATVPYVRLNGGTPPAYGLVPGGR
jgi:hypothetical protein